MSETRFVISRDLLASGQLSPHLQSAQDAGLIALWSDEQREANRRATLARHPAGRDIFVFGFGSLMWNPACHVEEAISALVRGWHRRFNLWTPLGRGTLELPGVMLGLERGGSCRGLALRIAADKVDEETSIIWRREMLAGAYIPTWVTADLGDREVDAVTFVINPAYERYAGRLSEEILVHHLACAEGPMGACIEYLEKTVASLDAIGHRSGPMHDLLRRAQKVRASHLEKQDRRDDA